MNKKQNKIQHQHYGTAKCDNLSHLSCPKKQISMSSLINWNVSKALEIKPDLDLKIAMQSAHERITCGSRDGSMMMSHTPEEQYITCALLAWQQLGHNDVESLHAFIEESRKQLNQMPTKQANTEDDIILIDKPEVTSTLKGSIDYSQSNYSEAYGSKIYDTSSLMGPVVKLPVQTKIVMRMDNVTGQHVCNHGTRKQNAPVKEMPKDQGQTLKNKIDAACCMDSACIARLAEMDAATTELRSRAARLARREAERVELLERAEAAWRDLELGYLRRLSLAEEKEDDMAKQIKHLIEERNAHKEACTTLAETLRERGDAAEKERVRLTAVEKEVCDRACVRLHLSEESGRGDAALAEQQCRYTQLDRDLQFKEEQARRKILSLESEIESARGLTHEAERAMRAELIALKEQIQQVSKQLLFEDTENVQIRTELDELRQEKSDIIEDLDGCKLMCDDRMQGILDDLKHKRDHLQELKERVIECRCTLPLDVAVEVKRTPSLAALCCCTPEDKYLESCSCTSLRSQLLSNLLSDLFSGLQSELGGSGSLMPCQLLKCLEDRHNWDRASIVKTNLRNFFAQLLVGELDIAIATSIEKYHAKWVGASCADQAKFPGTEDSGIEGWQERALERRAQKLATELAEELFKEKAEELTKRAKEIVTKGPQPCECKPQQAAVYPCLVKAPVTPGVRKTSDATYLKRTLKDVTQLRIQIEDLKKESIKREDLKHMEDKITKIFQRASKQDNLLLNKNKCIEDSSNKCNLKVTQEEIRDINNFSKADTRKKKQFDSSVIKKTNNKLCFKNQSGRIVKRSENPFKKIEQSFAVNLCLCGKQSGTDKLRPDVLKRNSKTQSNQKKILSSIPNITVSEPNNISSKEVILANSVSKKTEHAICPDQCICFHKIPSNTSIDKLLETLTKWNGGVDESVNNIAPICNIKTNTKENICEHLEGHQCIQKIVGSTVISKNLNSNKEVSYLSTNPNSHNIINDQSYKQLSKHNIIENSNSYPIATESEYMGAINLDKSNEDFCKCVIGMKTNSNDANYDSQFSYKCIDSDSCYCKKSHEIKKLSQKKSSLKKDEPEHNNNSHVYSVVMKDQQLKDTDTSSSPNNKINKENSRIRGDSFICDIVKKSNVFPCNCDYLVKFLGVTLTNTKDQPSTNNNANTSDANENQVSVKISKEPAIKDEHRCNLSNCKYAEFSHSKNNRTIESDKNKISDHKIIINVNSDEKCICCDNKDATDDLEVNAFNLLEAHLKEKLYKFKESCKSLCISPEEEENLFMSVLQKVKQVITDNTKNNPPCNCLQESENAGGSWTRAFGLLQEYLKIKIKRVQCSCIKINDSSENVLPSIMEKINSLIENDFKRLKDKYECVNNKDQFEELSVQIDFNKISDYHHTIGTNKSTDNISAQVPHYFSLENKSCDAIPHVKTLEKVISCKLGNNMYVTDCDCRCAFTQQSYLRNNVIVNQCHEILSQIQINSNKSLHVVDETTYKTDTSNENVKDNQNLPYIGYTLNCSCDRSLGSCLCTKSLVQTNKDKISCIWNSLISQNIPKKMSYIMHETPARVKSEQIKFLDAMDDSYSYDVSKAECTKHLVKSVCDLNINTVGYEKELVLKDSQKVVDRNFYDSYTLDEISLGTDCTNEHPSRWHECGSDQNEEHAAEMSLDKSNLYDSLYLPIQDLAVNNKSVTFSDSTEKNNLLQNNCNCKSVPICHVKMLVENIEKKLFYSKCTCDSLSSQVCPIHSKINS